MNFKSTSQAYRYLKKNIDKIKMKKLNTQDIYKPKHDYYLWFSLLDIHKKTDKIILELCSPLAACRGYQNEAIINGLQRKPFRSFPHTYNTSFVTKNLTIKLAQTENEEVVKNLKLGIKVLNNIERQSRWTLTKLLMISNKEKKVKHLIIISSKNWKTFLPLFSMHGLILRTFGTKETAFTEEDINSINYIENINNTINNLDYVINKQISNSDLTALKLIFSDNNIVRLLKKHKLLSSMTNYDKTTYMLKMHNTGIKDFLHCIYKIQQYKKENNKKTKELTHNILEELINYNDTWDTHKSMILKYMDAMEKESK